MKMPKLNLHNNVFVFNCRILIAFRGSASEANFPDIVPTFRAMNVIATVSGTFVKNSGFSGFRFPAYQTFSLTHREVSQPTELFWFFHSKFQKDVRFHLENFISQRGIFPRAHVKKFLILTAKLTSLACRRILALVYLKNPIRRFKLSLYKNNILLFSLWKKKKKKRYESIDWNRWILMRDHRKLRLIFRVDYRSITKVLELSVHWGNRWN